MKITPVLLSLLIPILSGFAGAESDVSWTNPLIPQRADPHVMLHLDGYYYFTATVPEYDRLELRRSKTIEGLSAAETKVVWKKT